MRAVSILPTIFMILLLCAGGMAQDSPQLSIGTIEAELQQGESGSLWIDICNVATSSNDSYGVNASDALAIQATLISDDERLVVLSGAMPVGSLVSGACKSVQFAVQVGDEASIGLYPLELDLSYKRLADADVSGDPRYPMVSFSYENTTATLPVEANVQRGAKIVLEPITYGHPGGSAEISIKNSGDKKASQVVVTTRSRQASGKASLGDMEPGSSASFKANVPDYVEPGEYPLSLKVEYQSGRDSKSIDLAGVLEVQEGGNWGLYIGLILAVLLVAGGAFVLSRMDLRKIWRKKILRKKW